MLEVYKGKRVLVTGNTGFKGSWMQSSLKYFGATCYGYALSPNTNPSHFELLNDHENCSIGNINDFKSLSEALKAASPEIVFHLAAQPLVRESYADPVTTYQTNVMGTLNLLQAVNENSGVKAIVIVTTDKVYDNREWDYPYREIDALGGHDMYSSSKACTEILASSFVRSFNFLEKGILVATARAGNVIGGGDWSKDRLIPDIVKATSKDLEVEIRNPNSIRPWQHVLDCLNGYLMLGGKLLQGNTEFTGSWNFAPSSEDSKTVGEIAIIAQSAWSEIKLKNREIEKDFYEAKTLKLDSSKAFSQLGWYSKWDTEKAVYKTIEWYREFYASNRIITQEQVKDYFSNGLY